MGFPKQEYWSQLSFSSPVDVPDPGVESMSSALAGGFFKSEPPGKPERQILIAEKECILSSNML